MTGFESRYWNLSQVAAWVVYRNREPIERFVQESSDGWRALRMYPTMRGYEAVGSLKELRNALIDGKLTAWGRRDHAPATYEEIPAIEWTDLWISPPKVLRSHFKSGQIEPWVDVRFKSGDVTKLWRTVTEKEGRTRFKWDELKRLWFKIVERLPEASQNEKIIELQADYEESGYGFPPSRSIIQKHIKSW